jgi:hypothetical protein
VATQWGRKETVLWPLHVPVMSYSALAAALLCTCLFIWQRLHFSLSPVQQSYITEYVRSQVGAKINAHENYRLIYLGGVKMRPRLALPVDITEGKTTLADGRVVPVALASLATAQGYSWYFRAPERKFYDASMHRWLRDAVYGGKGLLELFEVSLVEGGVCLAAMLWFAVPSDIKRFRVLKYGRILRGPVMMTPSEFNETQRAAERKMLSPESLRKLSCKLLGKEPPPPVMGIGFKTTECRELMRIPATKEAQHIQIIGDTGTGKSQLIMQILRQIRDLGEAAIVYDPATEFVKRFYDTERGDVVLNPLDARCPFWSPANEIERNAEAVTIAAHPRRYSPTCSEAGRRLTSLPHGWPTRPNCRSLSPEPRWRTTSIGKPGRRPRAFFPRWLLWRRAYDSCLNRRTLLIYGTRRIGRRSARVGSSSRRKTRNARCSVRCIHFGSTSSSCGCSSDRNRARKKSGL